jgi:hypothetical protein
MITNLIYKNENNQNHNFNRTNQIRESKAPNFSKAAKYDDEQLYTDANFWDE